MVQDETIVLSPFQTRLMIGMSKIIKPEELFLIKYMNEDGHLPMKGESIKESIRIILLRGEYSEVEGLVLNQLQTKLKDRLKNLR